MSLEDYVFINNIPGPLSWLGPKPLFFASLTMILQTVRSSAESKSVPRYDSSLTLFFPLARLGICCSYCRHPRFRFWAIWMQFQSLFGLTTSFNQSHHYIQDGVLCSVLPFANTMSSTKVTFLIIRPIYHSQLTDANWWYMKLRRCTG